ncbi:MAG: hypothetical protein ABIE74_12505 [Pseudomonadota bacterium]
MKRFSACLIVVVLLFSTSQAFASLKSGDLNKSAPFTQKQALQLQLDITSLYLTSCLLAFAPRVTDKNMIEVEVTLLDKYLPQERARLNRFLKRYFSVYVNFLAKRLKTYAPLISKDFDYKRDLVFVIDEGESRQMVARWENENLKWAQDDKAEFFPLILSGSDEMNIIEKKVKSVGKQGCKCPSLKD